MRDLGKDAFPELRDLYLQEGKTVLGYNIWDGAENYGLPKLEVKWVWTAVCNGDENHA